jgi:hypothetical protein
MDYITYTLQFGINSPNMNSKCLYDVALTQLIIQLKGLSGHLQNNITYIYWRQTCTRLSSFYFTFSYLTYVTLGSSEPLFTNDRIKISIKILQSHSFALYQKETGSFRNIPAIRSIENKLSPKYRDILQKTISEWFQI